jgi:hypothetical protein
MVRILMRANACLVREWNGGLDSLSKVGLL